MEVMACTVLWKKKKQIKNFTDSNFWILSLGHPTESFLKKGKNKNCRAKFCDLENGVR